MLIAPAEDPQTGLAVLPIGHVEDYRMGVELRSGLAIAGPRRVLLEDGTANLPVVSGVWPLPTRA